MKQPEIIRKKKNTQLLFLLGLITGLTIWSMWDVGFNLISLMEGIGETFRFIFVDMFPPSFTAVIKLIPPALDTLYISFVAMVIAATIAFFLSFFGAYNTTPHPILQIIVRGIASFLQSIPALVWVLILVAAYGLGLIVGTIALVLSGTGLLIRSFSEIIEEIDDEQVEALRATGANWFQIIGQAVVPQVLPGMVGWSLYKFDLNIREAAVIGMVGGGGIGFSMQTSLKLFQYKDALTAILIIFILVTTIEFLTGKVRERLL
ncbi:phosphonate ABC transporter, permease protein PhnE [Virgibacillus dokdonensis]|nr:phosphonate ABC transporter, permease protein PhnE [Virgibacillus dokdonensis]